MSDTFDHWGDAMNDLYEREYGEQDVFESFIRFRPSPSINRKADIENSIDLLPNLDAEDEESAPSKGRCPFCGTEYSMA